MGCASPGVPRGGATRALMWVSRPDRESLFSASQEEYDVTLLCFSTPTIAASSWKARRHPGFFRLARRRATAIRSGHLAIRDPAGTVQHPGGRTGDPRAVRGNARDAARD